VSLIRGGGDATVGSNQLNRSSFFPESIPLHQHDVKLDGTTRHFHRRTATTAPNPLGVNIMKAVANSFFFCVVLIIGTNVSTVVGDDYTAGDFHNYNHDSGDVPKNDYQYSVFVPKDYDGKKSYPVVFYLHGGGNGRSHPNLGKRNMVSTTLRDNDRTTDAGYSRNATDFFGYILVSPVKPVATWNARKFSRLYDHVKSKVSIDENRVYVTGFSMGGQGTWHVGCGKDVNYKVAAMMPLGAWGCNYVRRGSTPKTCNTLKTPVWVLHCPQDPVSMITEQLSLFQAHIDCGGYGRFTMIPGTRHLSRPRNDTKFFSMRMGWMLSQEYGTPFNYVLRVNGGTIENVASGARPFTGDGSRFGCYEPGTVVEISAPASKDGKTFVKWTGGKGIFVDASNRNTTYTTPAEDEVVLAIYDARPSKLVVEGGKASPAAPMPGQMVTVTARADIEENHFAYWKSNVELTDAIPTSRSLRFLMPSQNLELSVVTKESLPKRRSR
jgi:dienelactone hydrolase